jgi:hypothetical protein
MRLTALAVAFAIACPTGPVFAQQKPTPSPVYKSTQAKMKAAEQRSAARKSTKSAAPKAAATRTKAKAPAAKKKTAPKKASKGAAAKAKATPNKAKRS